jgi:PKD repeat protein
MRGGKFYAAIVLIVLTCISISTFGQTKNGILSRLFKERGELYFKFELNSPKEIQTLTKIISVDNVKGNTVYAYANQKEFSRFLDLGYSYETLTPPSMLIIPVMKETVSVKGITDWDFYPTYEAYVDMMYQFQADYPGLCQVVSIGQTVEGRDLLFARISDNVGQEEGEAQFMYTGTIHGDETTGFILLLRLIDYLLTNYASDPRIANMVNNLDIWINPAANPDGTYAGGNNTVYGATRENANWIDMNRNYPDPEDGPHPDGNAWQPETIAFMNFAESHRIVSSANTHGGTEVCNYPWDTWPEFHADDPWWQYVCHEYADTAQAYAPSNYMNEYDDGITNGYAWYTISGGRQDYMTFFHQCREFTLEMSDVKLLPANQLPTLWNYNYRSLLNYMEQTLFGISGTVTDAATGDPLVAEIYIAGHDEDSSWVYSDEATGKYFRLIHAGTYDVTFSAPGYYPQTIENVVVVNRQLTMLNFQLSSGSLIADFTASATNIPVGSAISFTDLSFGNPVSWQWTFEGASPSTSTLQNPANILYSEAGSFDVSLTVSDGTNSQTMTKENYITASVEFLMQNTTITTCSGVFYDSGGASSDYEDNEDYTLVLLPGQTGAKIECQFTSFNVEDETNCDYDWLKIYDGPAVSSPLIGTYCGTNSPGTVTATNTQGALTFVFHSDYSVTESGWSADISCTGAVLPPVADFTADITSIIEGESVHFTDLSANNPVSWNWTFEGGTPSTSTLENPVVVYNLEGVYDVTLTVTNEGGNNTLTKQDYIAVDHVTGLNETTLEETSIFPNPAKDFLMVNSPEIIFNISIVNILGSVVLDSSPNVASCTLDLSGFETGIYFVKIQTSTGTLTKKLQVQ